MIALQRLVLALIWIKYTAALLQFDELAGKLKVMLRFLPFEVFLFFIYKVNFLFDGLSKLV
ncbi:MAG: hypothetical protein BGO31_03010 [Bacteroidetes bacterium 43-16]|nr:MAG: hypothetical protein BGO31_03010 [Bacteroidetes bacterium 43-16]